MTRQLTEDELATLGDDGVVCLRKALGPEWLGCIAEGIQRVEDDESEASKILSMKDRGFMSDLFMWLVEPAFRTIVTESPMAGLAAQALAVDEVTHWYDQLFVKEPGADVPTPWHHDLTFWPIAGEQIVSFWIPVDPVTSTSSGLEFVKGSHRWPNRFKAFTPDCNGYMIDPALDDLPDIDADRSAYDIVSWEMEPGDVLAFNPLIVHGSTGNASATNRRRALASRWVGDDVVFAPRKHTMPLPKGHGLEAGDQLGGPMFPLVSVRS